MEDFFGPNRAVFRGFTVWEDDKLGFLRLVEELQRRHDQQPSPEPRTPPPAKPPGPKPARVRRRERRQGARRRWPSRWADH
jgi:hypothetical protein